MNFYRACVFIMFNTILSASLYGSEKYLFETKRLYFRPLTHMDAQALVPILGDAEVMHYAFDEKIPAEVLQKFRPKSFEEIREFLQRIVKSYEKNRWGHYAVIKKDDGAFIGYCRLSVQDIGDGAAHIELGGRLAKNSWGFGYATEAACAVRDYARDVLKLSELIAVIYPNNKASINVAQKAGFLFWKQAFFCKAVVNVYKIMLSSKSSLDYQKLHAE